MADDPQAQPPVQSHTSRRDTGGRFAPGSSGNPKGRPLGALGKATLLQRALRTADDPVLAARTIIDKAVVGNLPAAKFLVDRLCPREAARPERVAIKLPEGASPDDPVAVYNATVAAMVAGELAPAAAMAIIEVLEARARVTAAAAQRSASKAGRS